MSRGRFITFEGGEGAGKSTQVKLLAEILRKRGLDLVTTREPGGSPTAEQIRRLLVEGDTRWDPVTEALLHTAQRREHLVHTVRPGLERGAWVISDRFADSTTAYQGAGQGVTPEQLDQLYRLIAGDFQPDLTIILDLPVEEGLKRAAGRGGKEDRYERMGVAFHERIRAAYAEIAKRHPERCVVISALGDPTSVHAAVLAASDAKLGTHGRA
jgi:dTMP kinase